MYLGGGANDCTEILRDERTMKLELCPSFYRTTHRGVGKGGLGGEIPPLSADVGSLLATVEPVAIVNAMFKT